MPSLINLLTGDGHGTTNDLDTGLFSFSGKGSVEEAPVQVPAVSVRIDDKLKISFTVAPFPIAAFLSARPWQGDEKIVDLHV